MNAGRVYVTLFDRAYEARARLMVESLRAVGDTAEVIAVCFDAVSVQRTAAWGVSGVRAVSIGEVDTRFPALADARASRTTAEGFFTATPFVTQYAMHITAPGTWVTYLDADLEFHSTPEPIFKELRDSDAGVIPHRFKAGREDLLRYGTYNVGWVSFRGSERGQELLGWWADRCLEWCQDATVDGRFADQGYLDQFATVIPTVRVITHPGANLAPWNLTSHRITESPGGEVLVDGVPLVFFHHQGLRRTRGGGYRLPLAPYGTSACGTVSARIFEPYCQSLAAAESRRSAEAPARRGSRGVRARVGSWINDRARTDDLIWRSR